MDAWATISRVFHPETKDRTFAMVPPDRTGGVGGRPVPARQAYIQVRMRRMRLRYEGFLHKSYYPVVHSFVEVSRKGANRVIVPYVAGPGQLGELGKGDEQVIINRNVDLVGPTPYIGGTVNVALGLCAAEAKDYLENLVGLMGTLSSTIGSNPLTAVLPMIEPLKSVAESFLGMGNQVQLKLGTSNGFAEAQAQSPDETTPTITDGSVLLDGIYAVVGIEEAAGWGPWLHWTNGSLQVQTDSGIRDVDRDFIVFEVTQSPEMPDWERMPELNERAEAVMTIAVKDGVEASGYKDAFAALKVAVIESSDLIDSDRVRIVKGVEERARQLASGEAAPGGLGLAGRGPALARAVRSGPSIDEARSIDPRSL